MQYACCCVGVDVGVRVGVDVGVGVGVCVCVVLFWFQQEYEGVFYSFRLVSFLVSVVIFASLILSRLVVLVVVLVVVVSLCSPGCPRNRGVSRAEQSIRALLLSVCFSLIFYSAVAFGVCAWSFVRSSLQVVDCFLTRLESVVVVVPFVIYSHDFVSLVPVHGCVLRNLRVVVV